MPLPSPLGHLSCHLSQLCLSELFYYHFCDYYISLILNTHAASFCVLSTIRNFFPLVNFTSSCLTCIQIVFRTQMKGTWSRLALVVVCLFTDIFFWML